MTDENHNSSWRRMPPPQKRFIRLGEWQLKSLAYYFKAKPVHHPVFSIQTKNYGFTLIELLSAIAILGTLAAITVPSLLNIIDQANINLLAEQVRQSLKAAQQQAISEGYSYRVTFRHTTQGLQVNHSPVNSEEEFPGIMSSSDSPTLSANGEPQTWQNLSTNIPADQLIFSITDSPNNTITFTPEGDTEYHSKIFLAIGNLEQPKVNTRRCVNIVNSESGGSYFQLDKDLACDTAPNASPYLHQQYREP